MKINHSLISILNTRLLSDIKVLEMRPRVLVHALVLVEDKTYKNDLQAILVFHGFENKIMLHIGCQLAGQHSELEEKTCLSELLNSTGDGGLQLRIPGFSAGFGRDHMARLCRLPLPASCSIYY